MTKHSLSQYLNACADAMRQAATDDLDTAFSQSVDMIVAALQDGKPVLVCGNGGSMADAQHIAGELVARFLLNRKALNVIALGSVAATMTAWGNDIDFSDVFAREVEAFGRKGGVLLAISTSGNSGNILKAIDKAHEMGMTAIALTGNTGGKMADVCDVVLCPAVVGTPHIQEIHTPIYHMLCAEVEARCAATE